MTDRLEANLDEIVDQIVPESLDWERLVRTYPIPAVLLAGVGGFVLGLRHGPAILAAVSSFAAAEISQNLGRVLGDQPEPAAE
jgi:hypothetical protein